MQLLTLVYTVAVFLTGPLAVISESDVWYSVQNEGTTETDILEMLLRSYWKTERPFMREDGPAKVVVSLEVVALRSINAQDMEYTADLHLHQRWLDPRLAWNNFPKFKPFKHSIDISGVRDRLWLPDLFFRNGRSGFVHSLTTPNLALRAGPDGTLQYSQRLTVTFSCQMDLRTFPLDTQTCQMDIGSYRYPSTQLTFHWPEGRPGLTFSQASVPGFEVAPRPTLTDCTLQYTTSTQAFTCLKASVQLRRRSAVYIVAYYIPSAFLVAVSWISFWIETGAYATRLPLATVAVIGLVLQLAAVSATTNCVGVTALHVWLLGCTCFVFCGLVEITVTGIVLRRLKPQRAARSKELPQTPPGQDAARPANGASRDYMFVSCYFKASEEDHIVDIISRVFFPVAFLLFNLFYWLHFCLLV